MSGFIDVAAAVIRPASQPHGLILIAKRPADSHMGGFWEFPGGKVEVGETPAQAVVRELREELAIETEVLGPLTVIEHAYAEKSVRLHFFDVAMTCGCPTASNGAPLRWVRADELPRYEFPPANVPVVQMLASADASSRNAFEAAPERPSLA
ncbi:8-oxo-dGTP diphosphatase MutT [Verrucomicrobia bacterium LW23]|nr:8-oxo-dGTP diphosphatase MutT [Verrucomicrobia bacterium LW23]